MTEIPSVVMLDEVLLLVLWLVGIYAAMAVSAGLVWLAEKLLRLVLPGRNSDRRHLL